MGKTVISVKNPKNFSISDDETDSTVGIVSRNLVTQSNFIGFRNSRDFVFFEASRVTGDTWHLFGWLTMSHVSNGEDKLKVQGVAMCVMPQNLGVR